MQHTIRRATPVFWMTLLTFISGMFPVGIAVCLVLAYGTHPALLALVAVLGAGWLGFLIRAVRIRFVASDGGLVIGNLFSTRRVAWSEIAGLTTGLGASGLQAGAGRVELHVVLKAGATLLVTATDTATERFEQLVKELLPVKELATAHGVPFEWKNLRELETLIVERLLRAVEAMASAARNMNRG